MYYLECIYSNQKSFYSKAKVITKDNCIELYSYDTLVAQIIIQDNKTIYMLVSYDVDGRSKTPTTTRHQKEFFKQNGLGDNEIKILFKKGVYINE